MKNSSLFHMNCQKTGIFCLLFYLFTSGIFAVWVQVTLLALSLGLELYSFFSRKSIIPLNITTCLYIITFVFLLFNNANLRNNEYKNFVEYTLIFLFFISLQNSCSWVEFLIDIIRFFALIHAIATIALYFFPDFYANHILMLFHQNQTSELYNQYSHGWMPGLAPHYSTNGMYLSLGIGASLVHVLKSKKHYGLNILIFLIITVALLMTGKRAHTLFSVLSCMAVLLLYSNENIIKKLFHILLIFLSLAAFTFFLSSYIPALLNVINRFIATSQGGNLTMGRNILWATAIRLWRENPILGIGWDHFKYLAPDLVGFYLNVHNVYIQLLCEVGIVGSIAFYAFFLSSLTRCIAVAVTALKNPDIFSYIRVSVLFAVYMQVFFLAYCMTGNPLYDAQIFFPYICGCAMVEYQYRQTIKKYFFQAKSIQQ